MENSNHNIKLKGKENWYIWKFQTSIILKAKGVFEIVTGKQKKPENERNEERVREWVKKDTKAQEILVMGMEEAPMTHIINCESSEEMWEKLLVVYEQKSEISIHLAQQKFFNLKYEGEGISQFLSKIDDIKIQLKQLDEELSDNMVMTKILMALPNNFKHFVSAWESVPPG